MIVFLFNFFLLTAVTDAASTAPWSFPKGLMFGGKNIETEDVPYQAVIFYNDRPICGGVIISKMRILTSARCVYFRNPGNYHVRIGSILREATDNQKLQIEEIKLHGSYLRVFQVFFQFKHQIPNYDLAIIELKLPIEFNPKSQPIELFDEAEDVGVGVDAVVTGWNKVNHSEVLATRVVQTLDMALCNIAYKDVGGVPDGQICAAYHGAPGKDGCFGDSGGPLVVNGRLAGILSWGNGCVKPHMPGIYTAISYYRNWIDNGGRDIYSTT